MSETKHVYIQTKPGSGTGYSQWMTSKEALRLNRLYEMTGLSLRWIPSTETAKREYEELEQEVAE